MDSDGSARLRAVKAYIKGQLREIRKQRQGLQREDADAIHDIRVATRRLRAVLSEQGKWFPDGRIKRARGRLREVGRDLGRARELDVCVEILRNLYAANDGATAARGRPSTSVSYLSHALQSVRSTETSAIRRAAKQLEAPAFEKMFASLLEVRVRVSPYRAARPARRMARRYEDVIEAYASWRAAPQEEALHRLRIAFKKLRYTCEIYRKCAAPDLNDAEAAEPGPLAAFIEELKMAQDRLGEWHDMVVVRRYLAGIAEDAPECERVGCQQVMARLEQASAKRLAAFAAYARRFFGKTKMARNRALLYTQ